MLLIGSCQKHRIAAEASILWWCCRMPNVDCAAKGDKNLENVSFFSQLQRSVSVNRRTSYFLPRTIRLQNANRFDNKSNFVWYSEVICCVISGCIFWLAWLIFYLATISTFFVCTLLAVVCGLLQSFLQTGYVSLALFKRMYNSDAYASFNAA